MLHGLLNEFDEDQRKEMDVKTFHVESEITPDV